MEYIQTNILYANKDLRSLELIVSQESRKLLVWLTANKLIERKRKQKFVILSPTQERLTYQPKIILFDNEQNKNVTLA